MKQFASSLLGLLLVGCGGNVVGHDLEKSITLVETNSAGQQVRQLSFVLTDEPTKTCMAGNWKKAKTVKDENAYTMNPAYILGGERLEILLINEACDNYDSYVGTLSNEKFVGDHVTYGLGFSKTIGIVSGTYVAGTQ